MAVETDDDTGSDRVNAVKEEEEEDDDDDDVCISPSSSTDRSSRSQIIS